MTDHPLKEFPHPAPAAIAAVGMGFLTFAMGSFIAFGLFPPVGWIADAPQAVSASELIHWFAGQISGASIFTVIPRLQQAVVVLDTNYDLLEPVRLRLIAIGVAALASAMVAAGVVIDRTAVRARVRHLSGRELRHGLGVARNSVKKVAKGGRLGLELLPNLRMPFADEALGFAVIGGSGSGKTTILEQILGKALERGDRAVLLCVKGGMTETLPTNDFVMIGPHEARSLAINLAADLRGEAEAREFAARIIAPSKDPTWSNAGRILFTGVIVALQAQHGEKWGWRDLYDLALSDAQTLRPIMDEYYRPAAVLLELDPETAVPTRTTLSVLFTMWSAVVGLIRPLMLAWGDLPRSQRFSMRKWMLNDASKTRAVILQHSGAFPELSAVVIGAVLDIAAGTAASPQMSNKRNRRIWFALDEIAQVTKVERLPKLSELGREKGICPIVCTQDWSQIEQVYGLDAAKTWANNLKLKIVCQMAAGPAANAISRDWIGQRTVEWTRKTTSHATKAHETTTTESDQVDRMTNIDVFGADRIEQDLGLREVLGRTVVRALVIGLGGVFVLDWPLVRWAARRPAHIPAKWLLKQAD